MFADQCLRCQMHALSIELNPFPTHHAGTQAWTRSAVKKRISIASIQRAESGVKVIADRRCPMHRDTLVHMAVDAKRPGCQRSRLAGFKVHDLRTCMHAGIGATCTMNGDGCLGDMAQCLFELRLNRMAMRLTLPAAKAAAVIFDGECITQGFS